MISGLYRRGRADLHPRGISVEGPPPPSAGCPSHHQSPTPPEVPLSVHFTWHGHSNSILSVLNQLRLQRDLSDVDLVVEEVAIPAHKAVLAASSPYFRAMFTSSYSESSQRAVAMFGITPEALESLITYFYTSEINISTCNVQEVFAAASMLQVTSIRDACCQFIRSHLGVTNCLGVSVFADAHSCTELKQVADEFARKNFSGLVNSDEFLKLPVDQVMGLFSANALNVSSEEDVFESVLAWIKYDPVDREKFIFDLLQKVRLPLLSPAYICDRVRKVDVVQRSLPAMSLVIDVLECHVIPERKAGLSTEQTQLRSNPTKTQVILTIGGMGKREPTGTPSIERYDPSSRQWKVISHMVTGSWGAGVVAMETEKGEEVLLVGGSNESSRLSSMSKYNVGNDQWMSLAEMSIARNGVGVVFTAGLLYALGGFDGVSPLKSAECYNPKSNQWTSLPDMKYKRFGPGACVCEGKIYVVGGSDGSHLNSAECYNILTRSWATISPMSVSRKFPGVESLWGCVYVIGGSDAPPSMRRHSSVEKFIPSLNQWVTVSPLSIPRSGLCTVVLGGYIYTIGGHDKSNPLSSVERYDVLTNEWTLQPPMHVARDCASAVVVQVDLGACVNQVQVSGGRVSSPGGGSGSNGTSPESRTASPAQ